MKKLILALVVFGLMAGTAFAADSATQQDVDVNLSIAKYASFDTVADVDLTSDGVTDPSGAVAGTIDINYDTTVEAAFTQAADAVGVFAFTDATSAAVAPGYDNAFSFPFEVTGIDLDDEAGDYTVATVQLTLAVNP